MALTMSTFQSIYKKVNVCNVYNTSGNFRKLDKRHGEARTQHGSLQANRTDDYTHEDQQNQYFFTSNVSSRIWSLIVVLMFVCWLFLH